MAARILALLLLCATLTACGGGGDEPIPSNDRPAIAPACSASDKYACTYDIPSPSVTVFHTEPS
jgi:hypothetical protein